MRLLGGVADDVLHLLDEHGEHAAQRLGVGVVDGEFLLERLGDPAQHGLRHIAAKAKMTPWLCSIPRRSMSWEASIGVCAGRNPTP